MQTNNITEQQIIDAFSLELGLILRKISGEKDASDTKEERLNLPQLISQTRQGDKNDS